MESNPVAWFEIYVQDVQRAKAFYETVFKRKLERVDVSEINPEIEMWFFQMDMEKPGASGALIKMPDTPTGGNSTVVYFSCEDCAVEESRVVEAGGRVEKKKFSIGESGFMSLVVDSEENMIGLHSMK